MRYSRVYSFIILFSFGILFPSLWALHAQSMQGRVVQKAPEEAKPPEPIPDENEVVEYATEMEDEDSEIVVNSENPFEVSSTRKYSEDIDTRYSGKDFDYTETPAPPPKVKKQRSTGFWDFLPNLFSSLGTLLTYVLIAIGIAALLYIFYTIISTLFNNRIRNVNFNNNVEVGTSENFTIPDDITEQDYNKLAQKAEEAQDYRLAYRYLFLNLLQQLNQKSIIEWNKNKTNFDYFQEISVGPIKNLFKELSNIFNVIWYGNYPINALQYSQAKTEFNQVTQLIK